MEKKITLCKCPICKKGDVELIDYEVEVELMCTEHNCDFYFYRDAPLILQ